MVHHIYVCKRDSYWCPLQGLIMLTLSHLVHNLLAISNRLFKKHSQWNAPCQKDCRLPSCECNWLFLPTPLVRHLNSTSSGLYLCSTNVWASWFWERPGILDKNGHCSSCIPQLLISLCITCTNGLWQRSSHLHFECCFHMQAHGAVAEWSQTMFQIKLPLLTNK